MQQRQSTRASFRAASNARASVQTVAKVARAADVVEEKARQHYQAHKEAWAEKRFPMALVRQGSTLTLTPSGTSSDPAQKARALARSEVAGNQSARLTRIHQAKANMIASGKVRPTRKIEWGKSKQTGLGE